MHPKARERLRQLVLEAIDGLEVNAEGNLNTPATIGALRPINKFVEENFSEWLDPFMAFFDVYASVDDAVREAGLVYVVGPLTDVISAERREQIAGKVCDFWSAVPITYEFILPLPAFELLTEDVALAPGITFKDVPGHMVDYFVDGASGIAGGLRRDATSAADG